MKFHLNCGWKHAGAEFYQLNFQANWELVIMWVYDMTVASGYMRFN